VGIELRIRAEGGQWPPEVVSPETFLERLPARACFATVANLVVAELVRYLTGSFERVVIEEP
jgi:hypothetical protein